MFDYNLDHLGPGTTLTDPAWKKAWGRSRIRRETAALEGGAVHSSGVAGHMGISPCNGKSALRVAMIARSTGWPES